MVKSYRMTVFPPFWLYWTPKPIDDVDFFLSSYLDFGIE